MGINQRFLNILIRKIVCGISEIDMQDLKNTAATIMVKSLRLEYVFSAMKNRYILAYHRVVPKEYAMQYEMQDAMWVDVDTFRDDVEWFQSHGKIVSLDELLSSEYCNEEPMFAITFDDGWLDNYEYAYPILQQYGAKATVFLVSDAVTRGEVFWVEDFLYKLSRLNGKDNGCYIRILNDCAQAIIDRSASFNNIMQAGEVIAEHLKPKDKVERDEVLCAIYSKLGLGLDRLHGHVLNWRHVEEMSRHGIDFGSHTHTHEILQYLDEEAVRKELVVSKRIIESKLHKKVKYLCYPNARYKSEDFDLVRDAGYEYAFRIHNMPVKDGENPYSISRYLMCERVCKNKAYLLCKLLNIPKFI